MAPRDKNKNKNKDRNGQQNGMNPLYRSRPRRQPPRVDFDGSTLNFIQYFGNITTLANQASAVFPVDCSNTNIIAVPSATVQSPLTGYTGVTAVYNEYVYEKLSFHWIPFIGPGQAGAGSKIYAGYIDNAEDIVTVTAAPAATVVAVIQGMRNSHSWNAWEQHTFNVPLTRRRKLFDVNTNNINIVDNIDRSVQGLVATGINGINAVEALGQWKVTGLVRLIGLQTQIAT